LKLKFIFNFNMRFRHMLSRTLKWIYCTHLWLGLITGVVAALLGISGTVLIFRGELEQAFRPHLLASAPLSRETSIEHLVSSYIQVNPKQTLRGLQLPTLGERNPLVLMVAGSGQPARVYIDPATGLELKGPTNDWISWTVRLHHSLFLKGHFYTGLAGVALSLLCVTGVVVWWSSIKTFAHDIAFRPGRLRTMRARDVHIFAGVWLLIPLFLLAFSGTVFTWREAYTRVALALTRSTVQKQKLAAAGDARSLNLDKAIAVARTRFPEATPTMVRMPAQTGDPLTVRMRTPDDSRDMGTTQVFVNARAEVIGVEQPGDKPLAARAVEVLAPLHTGELGGWPLKLAWAFMGLVPPLLFFSGVRAAWRKYVRVYPARVPVPSQPELEVLSARNSDFSRKEAGR
jgi:uncharacterized iron-regulated membrane protein